MTSLLMYASMSSNSSSLDSPSFAASSGSFSSSSSSFLGSSSFSSSSASSSGCSSECSPSCSGVSSVSLVAPSASSPSAGGGPSSGSRFGRGLPIDRFTRRISLFWSLNGLAPLCPNSFRFTSLSVSCRLPMTMQYRRRRSPRKSSCCSVSFSSDMWAFCPKCDARKLAEGSIGISFFSVYSAAILSSSVSSSITALLSTPGRRTVAVVPVSTVLESIAASRFSSSSWASVRNPRPCVPLPFRTTVFVTVNFGFVSSLIYNFLCGSFVELTRQCRLIGKEKSY
ncbi:hypothetical protein AGDE_14965 [Angomonas deanei]|uniref:Uncharacterized protein n=1 Tax=Angomonas deanei TaxID=59799 RepID=A0A7G2CA39_9TRYP|nr:hypothetical protein AGDE_14965 [Angomonas deanei]CAD2215844.1 hypothetical protein, conserved [Angomonas deanei]|eukprot:EPY19948.1 hypothetical protein AGDE_14965 [Angomonas deanei]